MRKPNLFVVGHPRTGTSSFHDYLNHHPDIFMTPIKEPNFFAKDFHAESDRFHGKALYFPFRTEDRYMRLYKNWGPEKLAGDASATTLFSKVSAETIFQFNPKAKIIMSFREPVDFLYSYHSTAIFSSGEHLEDFEEALSVEQDRKEGRFLSKRVIAPSWLYYSEFIRYADQLNRFLRYFSKDQVKVLIFDDLKEDVEKIYGTVLEFLEVDGSFLPDFTIVNPYKKNVRWPRLKHMLFDSPYFRKLQHRILSDEMYGRLTILYRKLMLTQSTKKKIDPELKHTLMKGFAEEVHRLSERLDRDLVKAWGYDGMR